MAESVMKNYFPSQTASDDKKISMEYGLEIAKAIENEWFKKSSGTNRYLQNQNNFHKLKLYARGEQSIQKYKDELSINGDLSYLNLDWKPVPIIPKFVDIVVNGIAERTYDIKAYSQDPFGVQKRTAYMQALMVDMETISITDYIQQNFGINLSNTPKENLPANDEELQLHMQLNYKQAIEIAEEQAIETVFNQNNYELIKKRFYYDLAVVGMGCVKNIFTQSEGIKIEYVDPANLVYSKSESPYFDDLYYIGEMKSVNLNELKKEFPNLTNEDIDSLLKNGGGSYNLTNRYTQQSNQTDNNTLEVLYFNYKTYMNEVYKVKETSTGAEKIIRKTDAFNPPTTEGLRFERIARNIEVLYEGVYIPGAKKLLKWELCKNMLREKSDANKVKLNYSSKNIRFFKDHLHLKVI